MKTRLRMLRAVPAGLLTVCLCFLMNCCGSPCLAQEKPLVKPVAQPEILDVPVPPSVLAKLRQIHVGSTRGFLEKTLALEPGAHWLPNSDFIYLIPAPAEFQKKHPGYYIGLRVTFGHDYLPATLLNPPGMSKTDKDYNKGYNSAVVTALGKPFVTLRTPANSGPNIIY